MKCPKCGFEQSDNKECIKCGIVIEKYLEKQRRKQQEFKAKEIEELIAEKPKSNNSSIYSTITKIYIFSFICVTLGILGLIATYDFLNKYEPGRLDRLLLATSPEYVKCFESGIKLMYIGSLILLELGLLLVIGTYVVSFFLKDFNRKEYLDQLKSRKKSRDESINNIIANAHNRIRGFFRKIMEPPDSNSR